MWEAGQDGGLVGEGRGCVRPSLGGLIARQGVRSQAIRTQRGAPVPPLGARSVSTAPDLGGHEQRPRISPPATHPGADVSCGRGQGLWGRSGLGTRPTSTTGQLGDLSQVTWPSLGVGTMTSGRVAGEMEDR